LEPIPTAESTAPAPSATALPSREVQAFRTAYALQLRLRDPLRALAAWDALLQREPSASLAMEARFNRALCLVQLGRRDAARQALASFATGRETNEYRRREALALLRNLGVSP
jgi:tetratricopeptide (TPR) repeat protein